MSWSTADLQAYLAGDASAADAAAIEAELLVDPALEDRLMALDPLAEQLQGASAAIAGPSKAQTEQWTMQGATPVQATGFSWRHIAAAAVIGAVVVGAGWFATAANTAPDWRAEVATYQALYSPETIATITFDDQELIGQIEAVGARLDFKNLVEVTESMSELKLLRGQLLAHQGQPLGQIVFATADGQPIALCLIERNNGQVSDQIEVSNRQGLMSASFETAEHSWLLIGTQDRDVIARAAQQVVDQLATL